MWETATMSGGTCEASEVQRLLGRREEGMLMVDEREPIIQALGVLQEQVDALNQQMDALKCQQVDAHKLEREESPADAPRASGDEEKMSAQERLQQAAERWRTQHGATTGKDPFLQMVDVLHHGLLTVTEQQQRMAEQLTESAQQVLEEMKLQRPAPAQQAQLTGAMHAQAAAAEDAGSGCHRRCRCSAHAGSGCSRRCRYSAHARGVRRVGAAGAGGAAAQHRRSCSRLRLQPTLPLLSSAAMLPCAGGAWRADCRSDTGRSGGSDLAADPWR
jgi:hypothetical protein